MPTRSLRTSLLLALFVVALVPLGLSAWKLITISREVLKRNQQVLQVNLTSSLAQTIRAYLDVSRDLLTNSVTLLRLGADLPTRLQDPRLTAELEDFIQRYPDRLLKLYALDAHGRGTAAQNGPAERYRPADQLIRVALKTVLAGTRFTSYPTAIGSGGASELCLVYAEPVRSGAATVGLLAAVVSLQPIQDWVEEVSRQQYRVFVVDSDGRLVAHADRKQALSRADMRYLSIVADLNQSPLGTSGATPFSGDGERYLGAYSRLEDPAWSVVAMIEEDLAYAAIADMRRQTATWALVAALLALAIGLIFARQLSEPLRRLAESTRSIARGDFSQRIEIRSRNEIGMLADTFNEMVGRLQSYVDRLKWAARENRELFLGSLRMITAAVDEKDPYTKGHSERVMKYSMAIARHMGLPEEEVEKIGISALLHDVGKIGIDDDILKKRGELTPEEFEIMKLHPEKGARIMEPVEQLRDMLPGLHYHHERVDGRGYPAGLKGEEIPVVARIIAVADTFDAMTTQRPYQEPRDLELVLRKMTEWIGSRYDGRAVRSLIAAIEHGEIKPRSPAAPPRSSAAAGVMDPKV